VRDDWRADVDAAAELINDNTVLVVGSAPQYPQGVIDPIPELAALAAETGANFHTDACMGGFVLPFMEELGEPVAPWDFRVEGVTTISADLHKLGYAPKGASVILHRNKALRQHQTFVFDDWLGGFYASPGMQGTRAALPMACAWATLHHHGREGYQRLTPLTHQTRRRMVEGIRAIPGLATVGEPEAHLVAITTAPGYEDVLDVFALGDALQARGWFHDRQKPPDSLHATVSAGNAPVIEEYLADLAECVTEVGGTRLADRSTSYATLE
jgi:glutamate/tyrosine decarboxylase-like PLP-dependent enzyme